MSHKAKSRPAKWNGEDSVLSENGSRLIRRNLGIGNVNDHDIGLHPAEINPESFNKIQTFREYSCIFVVFREAAYIIFNGV